MPRRMQDPDRAVEIGGADIILRKQAHETALLDFVLYQPVGQQREAESEVDVLERQLKWARKNVRSFDDAIKKAQKEVDKFN